MSAARGILTRESLCATCLSQDRKLFPVNDSKLHSLLLNLSEGDVLCWECNFFMMKVAAFQSRAAKAQALLASALQSHKKANTITSLSSLTTGPITLEISLTPDPLQVNVKTEPSIKEEQEVTVDTFYECSVEVDNENSYKLTEESDDEKVTVTLMRVFNKSEEKSDEAMGDEVGDSSFKSVLSRKGTPIKNPTASKKPKKNDTVTKNITAVKINKEITVRAGQHMSPVDSDSLYTVKIMTEEELVQWRERKINAEYYTSGIANLRCEQCIEPFRSVTLYTAHSRRHEEAFGAFECDICGLRSVSESALSAHTTQHYSLLQCTMCGHEWDNPNQMRQHCNVTHNIPVTVWDCDQCERKFPTARKLARHLILHRVVTCSECGKQVGWNSLKTHMRLHEDDGIPLRTCTVCGGQYRGDHGLAAHMATHDTKVDEEAFCADCNIQFRSKQIYRNHLRYTLKHAQEKPRFKCEFCGKCFPQRAYWQSHVDSVHSVDRKHACDVCGKTYKTRNKKRTHERTVHEGVTPARKHICDHCGKGFMTKKILQQHMNTHTGARPYACALCDATFGFDSALYLHGRYKHGINQNRRKRAPVVKKSDVAIATETSVAIVENKE